MKRAPPFSFWFFFKIKMKRFMKQAKLQKKQILQENNVKSGIYLWTNLINGKQYLGSSVDLWRRLSQYFSQNHLKRCEYMYICRARPPRLPDLSPGEAHGRLHFRFYPAHTWCGGGGIQNGRSRPEEGRRPSPSHLFP
uniref:GIY-YIG endonuclease n=1 Tax=Morchella brunnea TaxID=1174671 RepID=A0A8K1I5L1_9PEZI|nr:GIY-YIG endonuclease [Morchella brunnea]UBU98495.1 GIY-YIG endonuclease [Morchella brunnea]